MQAVNIINVGSIKIIALNRPKVKNAIDAELAQLAADNDWAGIIVYGAVRQIQQLENIDIGIHALAPIPVGADENNHGESDLPVNFGGVTFFPEDYIYADLTGIILSQEALDLGDFEEE